MSQINIIEIVVKSMAAKSGRLAENAHAGDHGTRV